MSAFADYRYLEHHSLLLFEKYNETHNPFIDGHYRKLQEDAGFLTLPGMLSSSLSCVGHSFYGHAVLNVS